MDPISALIGGGMSLAGGLMSSASTASVNQQNIANQQAMASGAYLPQLIANANKAGINPLAVLGIHTPSAGMAVPTDPGAGLRGLGANLAQTSLHQLNMQNLAEEHGRLEVENLASGINNQNIQNALRLQALRRVERNPQLLPADFTQPAVQTGFGLPQIEFLKDLVRRQAPGGQASGPDLSAPTFDQRYQLW